MSKILITGATGFVGQALCKKLREGGHQLTGTTRTADKGAGPARVPLYHIPEIGADTDWSQAVSGADIVIHLAARVHVMKDRATDPLAEFRRVNTAGTKKLAQQAAAAGVKRLVFISTVKVAGELSPVTGFSAQAPAPSPAQPEDAYSVSKWEAEQALAEIAQTTDLEIVILRPPLVYGPGVKGNFRALMEAIQNGWPLPLGTIENQRSLLFVGNLAAAIATAASHPNAGGKTYFVSDNDALSTPHLIKQIAAALNTPSRLFNFPLVLLKFAAALTGKTAALQRLTGSLIIDNQHICSDLDWQQPFPTSIGLQQTADWLHENPEK